MNSCSSRRSTMKKIIGVVLVSVTAVGCAAASDDELTGEASEALTTTRRVGCSSRDYRYESCDVPTDGGRIVDMRLVRQESHAACTQGSTFGFGDTYVWVDHGCRGEFEVRVRSWGG